MTTPLFKILTAAEWAAFERDGRFEGSPLDREHGFIHLSAADQVAGVVGRYFAGKPDLVVAAIDRSPLERHLKWETVGDGIYPHFYGVLERGWVISADALPDDPDHRALTLALIAV